MRIGIVGCSNGQKCSNETALTELFEYLEGLGLDLALSPYLYDRGDGMSAEDADRALALKNLYREGRDYVFDISGGDAANGILPYLEDLQPQNTVFWGYSDLTTLLNMLYTRFGVSSVLYQVRNLIGEFASEQREAFERSLNLQGPLFSFSYEMIQGEEMEGILLGGNIRCLLKLAGTPYWPDFEGKILFLESYAGKSVRIRTYLNQLKQIGVFDQVRGVLLGTFTELEKKDSVLPLAREVIGDLPLAKTHQIGHGKDSKALIIGKHYRFDRGGIQR